MALCRGNTQLMIKNPNKIVWLTQLQIWTSHSTRATVSKCGMKNMYIYSGKYRNIGREASVTASFFSKVVGLACKLTSKVFHTIVFL